ncbi:MAG: exo-alpha-sialidase, partial [Bacteroidota bacterium]|nr:exo-alpha-sialidase [Bacteroidota bacterium]
GKFRSIAVTKDMGKNWSESSISHNTLNDPVCMGNMIKALVNENGLVRNVLFFSNCNNQKVRADITIKASLDSGETWPESDQLLIDQRKCYGYSSITKIDKNTLGILYEGRKSLYFVKIPVNNIIK